MINLTLEVALSLANMRLSELASMAGDEFVIFDESTIQIDSGWVFFYNSKEFVETGNPVSSLGGNGPIFVKFDGSVHCLPTSTTWELSLKNME